MLLSPLVSASFSEGDAKSPECSFKAPRNLFVHAERCLAKHAENFNQNRNFSDSFSSGGNRVEEVDFY